MDVSFSGESLSNIEEEILKQAAAIYERRRQTLSGAPRVYLSTSHYSATAALRTYVGDHAVGAVVLNEQPAMEARQELTDWLVRLQREMTVSHDFVSGPPRPIAWDAPLRASAEMPDPAAALAAVARALVNLRCAVAKQNDARAAGIAEACDVIGGALSLAPEAAPSAN